MDAVSYLVCLLVGIAIPVGVLFALSRRVLRQVAVASAYRDAARQLQLDADTRGTSIHGHVGDRRLWVGEVMTDYGTKRATEVVGILDLERPLGQGLYVHRRGDRGRWRRAGRSPEQGTGDTELDRRLHVHADDAARVRALLLAPPVRKALSALASRWPRVELTDGDIRVRLRSHEATTRGLLGLVDAMRDLAEAVESASRDIPPSPEAEARVQAWGALAERLGLTLEPWLPAISGRFRERRVLLALVRTEDGQGADLRLWFQPHRPLGLRLRPQVEPDGYWSVGQDIQVGHPRFDAAFVIKAWDPVTLVHHLSDEARARILALSEAGWLVLDDRGLELRGLPPDPEALEGILLDATAVAEALGW